MNFCILPETLAPLLDALCKVVPTKPRIPALGNVYLSVTGHQITLQTSNFAVHLIATTDKVGVERDGQATVPAKALLKLIKSLDVRYRLDFASDGKVLTVIQGEHKSTLPTLPVDSFPVVTPVDNYTAQVDAGAFKQALAHLVKVKSARHPAHLVVAGNTFVGTAIDGARLHRAEVPATGDLDAYIALDDLKTLAAALPKRQPALSIGQLAERLYVRCGDLVWIGTLTKTTRSLPVFEPPVFHATLDTDALLLAIRRAKIMAYKDVVALRTDATGQLCLYAENADLGDITCSLVPDDTLLPLDWRLDVNGSYLRDALANASTEQITLRFGFGTVPVWIEPVETDGTARLSALVMPVHFDSAHTRKSLAELDQQWDEDARAATLDAYRWLKAQMDDMTRAAVLAREVAYREQNLTSFRDWAGNPWY